MRPEVVTATGKNEKSVKDDFDAFQHFEYPSQRSLQRPLLKPFQTALCPFILTSCRGAKLIAGPEYPIRHNSVCVPFPFSLQPRIHPCGPP